MANLPESPSFDPGIYQLETSDPVLGGPAGVANQQAKQLANRTSWLKEHVDAIEDGSFVAPGTATQGFVIAELEKLDHKQSVRIATTTNISLTGVQTIDGVAVVVGDRVLVKNQTAASQNGIYIVSASGWTRAGDSDDNASLTSGLTVFIDEGTLQADSRWQLSTDAPIVVGTTGLTFINVTTGHAPLDSPAFVNNPTAPTRARFDNATHLATTAWVRQNSGRYCGTGVYVTSQTLPASDFGKKITVGAAAGPITLTLPTGNQADHNGAIIHITNLSGYTVTISRGGANTLIGPFDSSGNATSCAIKDRDEATFIFRDATWDVFGSSQLQYSATLAASFSANGYQKLPSGLIIQWGEASTNASGVGTATYSIAFPTAVLSRQATFAGAASAASDIVPTFGAKTLSSSPVYLTNNGAGIATTSGISWLIIGY